MMRRRRANCFIMENTENAFEWLCIAAEVAFNRGNIRKRHFLSLEMQSRRGSWSSRGKHRMVHAGLTEKSKGDDVLEEYEATNTLSGMRRALLGHIPETWEHFCDAASGSWVSCLAESCRETHLVLLKTTLYKEVQTPLAETLFSEH
ncbi:hypothetical protein G5714_016345 [Onychostoma macrolepis]|uniref:Uncharacterized protein n=1 Tax=Onychostoma macrolepis TaxID=369639 RepID=A0A7J6CCD9_9TELE|nr:hypothetical protein G5714_016345 [Onychostoma macrolepis]